VAALTETTGVQRNRQPDATRFALKGVGDQYWPLAVNDGWYRTSSLMSTTGAEAGCRLYSRRFSVEALGLQQPDESRH
jgi:hypothetical protein